MERQQLPTPPEPDMSARVAEVRAAERSDAHERRDEREAVR